MVGRRATCCFTGHRPEKLPWGLDERDLRCVTLKGRLADAVQTAYDAGMRHFICGMARGCDFYFAETVLWLRDSHPEVTLEAAIPCPTQSLGWSVQDRRRWQTLINASDLETMVQAQYAPGCMQRRNRYMVDHSAMIIAVYDGSGGGTQGTLAYAIRRNLHVISIRPTEDDKA